MIDGESVCVMGQYYVEFHDTQSYTIAGAAPRSPSQHPPKCPLSVCRRLIGSDIPERIYEQVTFVTITPPPTYPCRSTLLREKACTRVTNSCDIYLRKGLVVVTLKLRHDLRVRRDADQPAEPLVVLQEQRGILAENIAIRSL